MHALDISNLKKTYRNGVEALKGISFSVEEGDFFALLGPNGAGKSTTIGIITSLVNKSSGTIKVFGHDMAQELSKAKSYIGVVPQEFNFSIFEKAEQILINQAGYYGVPATIAKQRAHYYLDKLGILEKKDTMARNLSGGMKRRMMIARALVHHPKMLILDEPTAGVDIETRRTMWTFLKELNEHGTTIILTTHYLEEAENLCRNVAIIDQGQIILNDTIANVVKKFDKEAVVIYSDNPIPSQLELPGYQYRQLDDYSIEVIVSADQGIDPLLKALQRNQINIHNIKNKTSRLEELFLQLTKKA